MPHSLEDKLVIAVSSRAVFDLSQANDIFDQHGIEAYRTFQRAHASDVLPKGVAFSFVNRLLRLNEAFPDARPFEVVVLSRNSPETGQRFFHSCRELGIPIERGAFTSGHDSWPFARCFNAALFLSANIDDVRRAIADGRPAGYVMPGMSQSDHDGDEDDDGLRIAFDFDGVLADDAAEKVYAQGHLDAFRNHEVDHRDIAHDAGPLKDLITRIARVQQMESSARSQDRTRKSKLRIAIVTARGAPAEQRVVTTLQAWGIESAELYLLGGVEKKSVLEVFKPHIFFDDQRMHLDPASSTVPCVWVPFGIRNQQTRDLDAAQSNSRPDQQSGASLHHTDECSGDGSFRLT